MDDLATETLKKMLEDQQAVIARQSAEIERLCANQCTCAKPRPAIFADPYLQTR